MPFRFAQYNTYPYEITHSAQTAPSFFETLQWIALVILIAAIAAIIILMLKIRRLRNPKEPAVNTDAPADNNSSTISRWEEIQRHITSDNPAQWKLAVIEADKLVDTILQKAMYPGESMGERLSLISRNQLQSIDHLWFAHKLRNRIVHDPSFEMTYSDAREAIAAFEHALKELHALS